MVLLAAVDWLHYLFMIPMALLSVFLVLVILVQRGRGGGLTGALGGMGGQSAFGTKAGDLFTRITIIVAAIWVLLSMASLKVLGDRNPLSAASRGAPPAPTVPSGTLPGTGTSTPPSSADPMTKAPAGDAPPAASPGAGDVPPPASSPAAAPPADSSAKPAPSDQP